MDLGYNVIEYSDTIKLEVTHLAYSCRPDSVRMNGSERPEMMTFRGSP